MIRRLLLSLVLLAACSGHAQTPTGQGGMVPGRNEPVPPFGQMPPNTGGMTPSPNYAGIALNEIPGPMASLLATPTYSSGIGTVYSCSRNFYVATTGNDGANGSQATPWLTIQHADTTALQAGDCINVAGGTFTWSGAFTLTKGGNAASTSGYVTYRCQTLNACKIVFAGGSTPVWAIPLPYVVVDGFDVDGGEGATYGGLATACFDSSIADTGTPGHHIWILNNRIHGCNLSGITFN